MIKNTHSIHLYHNLWKTIEGERKEALEENQHEIGLIDDICFKADLSDSYEQYVKTLCDGMILLLDAGISRRSLENHPVIKEKILSMGDQILENSYRDSDQLYVGLFVKLRVKFDWLKTKFYKIVKDMLHHVLDTGLKISTHIKIKIKDQLKNQNSQLFKSIFLQTSP